MAPRTSGVGGAREGKTSAGKRLDHGGPALRANWKTTGEQENPEVDKESGGVGETGGILGVSDEKRENKQADMVPGKVALLVPGPSLPTVWHDDLFDDFSVVVGVNTTAHKFKVHWAMFSDKHIALPFIEKKVATPVIGIITNPGLNLLLRRAGIQSQLISRVEIDGLKQDKCAFTMPNALKFCYQFGDVEIFGMDFSNDKLDFAGQKGSHKNERWKREARWLQLVWDNDKIKAVHGRIAPERLEWLQGKRKDWPG